MYNPARARSSAQCSVALIFIAFAFSMSATFTRHWGGLRVNALSNITDLDTGAQIGVNFFWVLSNQPQYTMKFTRTNTVAFYGYAWWWEGNSCTVDVDLAKDTVSANCVSDDKQNSLSKLIESDYKGATCKNFKQKDPIICGRTAQSQSTKACNHFQTLICDNGPAFRLSLASAVITVLLGCLAIFGAWRATSLTAGRCVRENVTVVLTVNVVLQAILVVLYIAALADYSARLNRALGIDDGKAVLNNDPWLVGPVIIDVSLGYSWYLFLFGLLFCIGSVVCTASASSALSLSSAAETNSFVASDVYVAQYQPTHRAIFQQQQAPQQGVVIGHPAYQSGLPTAASRG